MSHPRGRVEAMEDASFANFAELARRLGDRARALGLVVPGFRSPPRVGGSVRTLRRRRDGSAVVAVQVRGRQLAAVAADLVEGVVTANGLAGGEADRIHAALLAQGPRVEAALRF